MTNYYLKVVIGMTVVDPASVHTSEPQIPHGVSMENHYIHEEIGTFCIDPFLNYFCGNSQSLKLQDICCLRKKLTITQVEIYQ